ncbi:MAG: MBG domain-containing protein, partial [Eubacterium sp.]|nr:MBG domain-containing protein [Eubacterium sp.]
MESLNKRKRLKKAISIFIAAIMILASSVSYPGSMSIYAADGDDPVLLDSAVSLGELEEVYYSGTKIKEALESLISVADGYDGEVYLEYVNPYGGAYNEEIGFYSGTWYVKAVAPETDNYNASESEQKTFRIEALPFSEVTKVSSGKLVDIEGLSNGVYAKEKITLKPADGFTIKTYMGDSEYTSALELRHDDLYPQDNGYNFNADYGFYFRREEDGAETGYEDIFSLFGNDLDPKDIVFDEDAPMEGDVYAYLDDEYEDSEEDSLEETIYATAIEFAIGDENLDKVTVTVGTDTTTYTRDDFDYDEESGWYDKSFFIEAVYGASKDITVTATDLAGWESSWSFTLKYPLSETTATVTVPDAYVGQDFTPVVETESDGKSLATFRYKSVDEPEDLYTEEKPTAAGEYDIEATIPETDKFEQIICYGTFTIKNKETVSVSLSVSDVYYGASPEPKVVTESDGKNDTVFWYKVQGADDTTYTTDVPTAVGKYTVMAVVPETDTYAKLTTTANFSIMKLTTSITVSVEDILVGETVDPKVQTDSDAEPVVEYKLLDDDDESAYTTVKPTAAGEYNVRASVAATATHQAATSDISSFVISRLTDDDATVTVANSLVGDDYEPVLSTDSDGKDGAVFEYKALSAPEEAYSETKPVLAGTYSVRATVQQTDMYEEVVCESSFTISKRETTATVTVPNTKVGQTYSPTLTTASDGKDIATFEYKLTDETEDDYSETQPTAAGEYTVRATVPETNTYKKIVCENTFTISLNSVGEATVTVPDTVIGTDYEPVLSTDSDGKDDAVFEYKVKGAEDSTYSEDKPTAAGDYTVRATIPETENYEEAVCYDDFTISKKTVAADVFIADTYVDAEYVPTLTTESDGKATAVFSYKPSDAEDDEYSSEKPSTVGTYIVRAVVPETDTYESVTATYEFTLSKHEPTVTVTIGNSKVGEEYAPETNTDSNGIVSYEYKLSDAEDDGYSSEKPTAAGLYTVKATVSETAAYLSGSDEADFEITKNEANITVTVADSKVGQTYSPVVESESNGTRSFVYKVRGANDSTYTDAKPTKAGKYTVKATIAATDYYDEISGTADFEITKNTADATVTVPNSKVGETYSPTLTTDSDGADDATYKYMLTDDPLEEYSETQPTAAGAYTVFVTVPETEAYEEATATAEFTISKNTVAATVTVPDTKVGETYSPTLTTVSDGKDDAVFEYKLTDDPEDEYST